MKVRNGFVSNSSSSSFIIRREYVSEKQLYKIKNHLEYGKLKGIGTYCNDHDKWDITVDEEEVRGYTSMNNFDMCDFLKYIGIDMNNVEWDD